MAAPTAFSCRSFADSVGFDVSMHVGRLQNRSCTMLVKNQSLPGPRFCLRELRGTWTAAFVFFYLVRSISEGATSAAHVTQHCCASFVVQRQALREGDFCSYKVMCVEPVASCVDVVEQFAWGLEVVMWYSSSNSARIVHLNSCRALKAPWGPLSMTTSAPHVRHHFVPPVATLVVFAGSPRRRKPLWPHHGFGSWNQRMSFLVQRSSN